jgi:hypothetical protein
MNLDSDIAQLWESAIPGVELFSARLFRHAFAKYMHEAYTLGINDGGQGCFRYQGKARCAYPQSFNLLNPGEVHTGQARSSASWIYRNLYISVPLIEQTLAEIEWRGRGLPYFREPVVWNPALQGRCQQLFDALEHSVPLLEQQSLLLEVLAQLVVNHAEPRYEPRSPKPEARAIAQIRAYLEATTQKTSRLTCWQLWLT